MIRFLVDEQGERQELGYAAGYFELIANWILNQKLAGTYKNADLTPPSTL